MSRFFHAGDSSDESSSSDEEELYSEDEEVAKQDEESSSEEEGSDEEESDSDAENELGPNRFLKDQASEASSDDEEKVTVVKSAKDKRLEELEGTVRLIENAEKINDWAVISSGRSLSSSQQY